MALHTVLSALRALILDGLQIPKDAESRRDLYRSRFQPLTEDELEELVIIPPEKFQIYTNTVFSGHRSTIQMHFPVAYALLAARLGKSFDGFRLVQELHAVRPWKGNATLTLAQSFVDFLHEVSNPYRLAAPEVADLAQMECLALEIARGFNPSDTGLPLLSEEQKGLLLVEELLARPVFVPENVRFFHSCFDVLALRSEYFGGSETLPQSPATARSCFYVGGRDRAHYVRWLEVSPTVYTVLTEDARTRPVLVEEIASAFLESQEVEATEEELFQQFMVLFTRLEKCGICFMPLARESNRSAGESDGAPLVELSLPPEPASVPAIGEAIA